MQVFLSPGEFKKKVPTSLNKLNFKLMELQLDSAGCCNDFVWMKSSTTSTSDPCRVASQHHEEEGEEVARLRQRQQLGAA